VALSNHPEERALREKIKKFKAEEEEHGHIGLQNDAENAPAYRLLSAVIKRGSKIAIEIAKRV